MPTMQTETESDLTRRAREVLAGLTDDARIPIYIRRVARRGIAWNRAPVLWTRLAAAEIVRRGRDSETGTETAFATDLGREVARLIAEGGR